MSDISREELMAMVAVQEKTAQHLERIAGALSTTASEIKDIETRLNNGVVKEISDAFRNQCEGCRSSNASLLTGIKTDVSVVKGDTSFLKIILGSATLIALISTVFLKFIIH